MRLSLLVLVAVSLSGVQAWFNSDTPAYKQWSSEELHKWLQDHNIRIPPSWSRHQIQELVASNWNGLTRAQYERSAKSLQDLRDSSFDSWDESRLRGFLVEQGVVSPSGPREQLVLQAKQRYRAFQDAAASFGSSASSLSSHASASASSAMYEKTKSLTSAAAQITKPLDDAKDYIYSTWDDSRLENYLRGKGLLKDSKHKTRNELLAMMRDAYAKVADPIWEGWSDSYVREWLIDNHVIKPDEQKKGDELAALMKSYFYNASDKVWNTWSDSELKVWLVDHGVVKSDAQINREKLMKLVQDNYAAATDTMWGSWSDSDIRSWLVSKGYVDEDTKLTREELIPLINDKYTDISTRTAEYLTWPDARLRAYLRSHGIQDKELPMGRPGLLQEVRIRWIQTSNGAEALFTKIRDIVNGGVEAAEDSLSRIFEILGAKSEAARQQAQETYSAATEKVGEKVKKEKSSGEL